MILIYNSSIKRIKSYKWKLIYTEYFFNKSKNVRSSHSNSILIEYEHLKVFFFYNIRNQFIPEIYILLLNNEKIKYILQNS